MAGKPWKKITCQFCGTADNLDRRETGRPRNVCREHTPLLQQIYRDRLREKAGLPPLERARDRLAEVPQLPARLRPVDTLLDEMESKYEQLDAAAEARKLIPITVKTEGPIGLTLIGDPHVDDNGCNIKLLRSHIRTINATEAMFAVPVGDQHNNWMGRLMRLWAKQSTSSEEAMQLVEWFLGAVPWLFIVGGNHDVWSGSQDPLIWLMRSFNGVYEWHGVRCELRFPNGRTVTASVNHNFPGFSMWNSGHGIGRAIQMGVTDHIVACGHKHVCAYMTIPARLTGQLCHGVQVGSYKQHDDYPVALGMDTSRNFAPSASLIINPDATRETELIQHFWDVEHAADYLTFLRARKRGTPKAAAKRSPKPAPRRKRAA